MNMNNMTKPTLVLVALLTVVSGACSEQGMTTTSPVAPGSLGSTEAKPGGKPSGDQPVTTTVQGQGGELDAYDIASDGGGAYTNSNAISVIQSVGAWLLDTNGSGRDVFLRFDGPIAGTGPNGGAPLAPAAGLYKARLIAQCNRSAYNTSMLAMSGVGATIACPLYVRFDAYRITMNLEEVNGTDDVSITCTATSNGACSAWTMTPAGGGVGVLDKQGRGTTWVRQGAFAFTFRIDVAKP